MKALRLENINNEAASGDSAGARDAFSVTYLDLPVLLNLKEHNVPLYIEAVVARTGEQKQIPRVNERAFYSYAASLLQKLKNLQCSACEKSPFTFDDLLLSETAERKTSSLQVLKMCLNTLIHLSYNVAGRKRLLTARAKT